MGEGGWYGVGMGGWYRVGVDGWYMKGVVSVDMQPYMDALIIMIRWDHDSFYIKRFYTCNRLII